MSINASSQNEDEENVSGSQVNSGQEPIVLVSQEKIKHQFNWKILGLALFFLLVLLAAGIYYVINQPAIIDTEVADSGLTLPPASNQEDEKLVYQSTSTVAVKSFNFSLIKPVFAQTLIADDFTTPSLPMLKPQVEELVNLADFDQEFSVEQLQALAENGFFLQENDFIQAQSGTSQDDFSDTYKHFSGDNNKYYREPDDALFVSSDAALHFYHILIDRSFQKIEETKFQPMLRDMTEALFIDSLTNYNEAQDSVLKDTYKRLAVYYLIPLVILDAANAQKIDLQPSDFPTYAQYLQAEEEQNKKASQGKFNFSLPTKNYNGLVLSDEIFNLAQAEIDLILAAEGAEASPLFTPYRLYFSNDYSQFKPRSHYTKNDILKSYFIAMMWYGRMGFSLDSTDLTRDAIVISGQINNLEFDGQKIASMYADMNVAIEFFVGEVDDLTPFEYTELIQDFYGNTLESTDLLDEARLNEFIKQAIATLPQPRIVSEVVDLYDNGGQRDELLKKLMQFRFMGQRFTPDTYAINQLTQGVGVPDPETGQNLPSMTTALLPINVIVPGNKVLEAYIDEWVAINAPDSDRIIKKKSQELQAEFGAFDSAVWTQNIYWSWLNSYRSLLGDYDTGYPYFMTTDAWQRKNIGTVLGSYTELKHDTLLYAKQSYAERGGGGDLPEEIPPVPKGYVEADSLFWSRIIALAKVTTAGLKDRGLMPDYFGLRYDKFIESCELFSSLVQKELNNELISEEDFEKLRVSGYSFDRLTMPLPNQELTKKERRAGIIADIHTDAVSSQVLYEATGKPFIIYTAVKDKNGARLTRGVVFNHYEFTGPLGERYADEDWQARIYDEASDLPEMDKWSQELIK